MEGQKEMSQKVTEDTEFQAKIFLNVCHWQ